MLLHHTQVSEGEKKESENQFREVAEAYEVLSDAEKKARYDMGEDPNEQQPNQQQYHQQYHQYHQQFHFHHG